MESIFISEIRRFVTNCDFETNKHFINNIERHNKDFFLKMLKMGQGIEDASILTNFIFRITCETPLIEIEAYKIFINYIRSNKVKVNEISDRDVSDLIYEINQKKLF